eukprot:gene31989-39518_t
MRDHSVASTKQIIGGILFTGLAAGLFLSQFWSKTIETYNHVQISLPLYVMFFVLGACSSASNVAQFTLVSHYSVLNTSALATGMGIGSMISGILAILQGTVWEHAGFTTSQYFVVLSMLYVPALLVIWSLPNHDEASEPPLRKDSLVEMIGTRPSNSPTSVTHSYQHEDEEVAAMEENLKAAICTGEKSCGNTKIASKERYLTEYQFVLEFLPVLFVQFYNAVIGYGMVPALVSLACSKFNDQKLVLLLATSIAAVIDPLFRGLTAIVQLETAFELQMTCVALTFVLAGLLLSVELPQHLALFQGVGGIFPITLYVTFGGLFGYSNTCVYRYFKSNVPHSCMRHAYRWSGMATQFGALVGSLLAFCLIITNVIA